MDVRERNSMRPERVVSRLMEGHDPENELRHAFKEARPRSREDVMLDVRFSTGRRQAFGYHFLTKVEYEPADVLRLYFATDVVRIEGRRLVRLYELLTEHRSGFVQEGNVLEEGLKAEEAPHIDAITLEEVDK